MAQTKPQSEGPNTGGAHLAMPGVLLILIICLVISGIGYFQLKRWDDTQIQKDLAEVAGYRSETFKNSLQEAVDSLKFVRAFFDSSQNVERGEFRIFVSTILKRHLEFLAIDWLPRVPVSERAAFEAAAKADGFSDFAIRFDVDSADLEQKDAFFPVQFTEPVELGKAVLGLDPRGNPKHEAVIKAVIESGQAGMTPVIPLHRLEGKENKGFHVYLPVYDPDLPFGLQGQKSETLRGLLRIVLSVKRLFAQVMGQLPDSEIQMYFFEGAELNVDHLLYRYPASDKAKPLTPQYIHQLVNDIHWEASFDVAGSAWTVLAVPTPSFLLKKRNSIVWLLPSMGGLLTLILAYILFNNLSRVQKIEKIVATRTVELSKEIQERRRAEQNLEDALSLMKAIFESANQTIISTDIFGVIRSINRTAERLLGYSAEEIVGKVTPEIIHVQDEVVQRALVLSNELGFRVDPGFETFVAKTRIMGTPDDNEWTYVRKDGSRFPVLLSVTALRDAEGHITGYVGIGYDITERKKVDRMKNEFISTVSHELRTPLTSIRGSLGLIAGGLAGAMPPQAKPLVEIAMNNCERLVRLINDILDIEKIESGKMEFRNRPFALVPLLEQTILANESYGRQYGVSFRLDFDGGDARVNADPDRITQVVTNLLSNAAKFSPQGSEVLVTSRRVNGKMRVSIFDKGPGIPEAFRARIFQKFAQADASDSRQKGGTGLGLNICKAIIEKLGGVIGFETELDKGTVFYFELPEYESSKENRG